MIIRQRTFLCPGRALSGAMSDDPLRLFPAAGLPGGGRSGMVAVKTMNIHEATQQYEQWLGKRLPLLKEDLALKHRRMAEEPFAFLRATYYRWVQLWPQVCPRLADAPPVLAVGDLHVENFGTWRDAEGRLIWGINDFDEAAVLPYTHDLVRLATSELLAIRANHLPVTPDEVGRELLAGYAKGLAIRGEPFVLSERHPWLRDLATNELRDPVRFWAKLTAWPAAPGGLPAGLKKIVAASLPRRGRAGRVLHREAGLGSLGRQRYTVIAEHQGGWIAREAKPLVTSACDWESGRTTAIQYANILARAVRAMDPFVTLHGGWLLRRLSPYCSRIELADLPKKRDHDKLLRAMGRETANIHLGTPAQTKAIERDLKKRHSRWLRHAAEDMAEAVLADWKDWAGRSVPVSGTEASAAG